MYPMLKEGISLGIVCYEDSEDCDFYVENCDGEEFVISENLYKELLTADGTKPFKNRWALSDLEADGIIRTSRFVFEGIINRFIILPIGRRSKKAKRICEGINAALPYLAFIAIAVGIVAKMLDHSSMETLFHKPLYIAIIGISILLHEGGHFCAAVKNDCDVSDIGLLLMGVIPIGAYVSFKEDRKCSAKGRLQVALAGIEANLFFGGLLLMMSSYASAFSFTLFSGAITNILIVITNLLPAPGLDGEAALSAALDVKSFGSVAKKVLSSKEEVAYIAKKGVSGYVFLALCVLIYISQTLAFVISAYGAFYLLTQSF